MRKLGSISSAVAVVLLLAGSGSAVAAEKENGKQKGNADPQAVERLLSATVGRAQISYSRATGVARFVTVAPDESGASADLMAAGGGEARGKSSAFLNEYVFGLRDARELVRGRDEADGGTWSRSIIDLAHYTKPNDTIRLRFDLGNDSCAGRVGWYLDDVQVYKCP